MTPSRATKPLEMRTCATLAWEDPVALFDTPWLLYAGPFVNYDVNADGQRFVFLQPTATERIVDDQNQQITVVLNWHQELLERVPVP